MVQIDAILNSWDVISNYLSVPETEEEYARLVELADYLVDNAGINENHKLLRFIDTIFQLISRYEEVNISEPEGDPIDCLKYLMAEHSLKQKDMIEIGSPGVISEVLNRKRSLNTRQIKALSNRFGCSSAVFL